MADVKQKQNRVVGLGFAVDVELGLVQGNNECVEAFVYIDPNVQPYYQEIPREHPGGNGYDIVGLFTWQLQLCQLEDVNTYKLWSETEDYGNGPDDIPGHRG